jgi:transposase
LAPEEPVEVPAAETAPAAEETKVPRKRRKNKGRRDISQLNHLRTVEHRSVVEDRSCPCGCGAPAVTIGEDITWRLERVPAQHIRHKNVVEKVVFPDHREQGVVTAPAPVNYALPKAMCANQLLAHVAVDKYLDHLPLFRQAERFTREGLDLHRSTLSRWMMELGELLRPIVSVLAMEVLSGSWLRADATGMPVLDRSRTKGKAHHGHFWAYGNYDSVVFAYTPTKEASTVAALFEGFQGTVVLDGATDFNLLEKTEGVTRAGCWAHTRRYFYEAIKNDAVRAAAALTTIHLLFMAERTVMGASEDQRLELRDELCRPIAEGFRQWVDAELPRVVPRSPIHKALNYVRNQWDRLVVFLDVPTIPCHNNDTERDLRRPVKGKHNYTFAGSPRGARAATVYYSLFGTCLVQGLDPERYLVEILGRLDEPASRLTPQAIRDQWLEAAKASTTA